MLCRMVPPQDRSDPVSLNALLSAARLPTTLSTRQMTLTHTDQLPASALMVHCDGFTLSSGSATGASLHSHKVPGPDLSKRNIHVDWRGPYSPSSARCFAIDRRATLCP